MTDPIQAAIEKAEEACPCRIMALRGKNDWPVCAFSKKNGVRTDCACLVDTVLVCNWPGHAAIRALAALVREYGHVAGCGCHDEWSGKAFQDCDDCAGYVTKSEHKPVRDPRCLPDSREVKHGD